jgi:class 3 adenylate cyclase/tetratricopeptide (TPR) repeat protein
MAAPGPVTREARKTVTVLFSDLVDSTRLGQRLDPESHRLILGRWFERMRAAVERHGGTVEKFIGDAVMAVFGIPLLHDDDALRAVRAAADMRTALDVLNKELERDWGLSLAMRTGINTGDVVAGGPLAAQPSATGDAINLAARLEQAADQGQVLVADATYRLVRDAVEVAPLPPLAVKGRANRVAVWRLLTVYSGAPGRAPRLDGPLVGRATELEFLMRAFRRVVGERTPRLLTVLGPAGVGKSRLVHEFLVQVRGETDVLRGRCLDYGEAITYWPVAEIVYQATGASEVDTAQQVRRKLVSLLASDAQAAIVAERVTQLVGLTADAAPAEELHWAVRRLLEGLAHRRPLIVVLDDLQWAEPSLLDLIEHVADLAREAPLLLCGVARPELGDLRGRWGGGQPDEGSIQLEPLTTRACRRLIDNVLGNAGGADDARVWVAQVSQGNPLFVEELLAHLVDQELLVRSGGRWSLTDRLDRFPLPPTIAALLSARIERLPEEERSVLERASVVGKVFTTDAVSHLSPEPARVEVAARLLALVGKGLLHRDHRPGGRNDAFRFRHLLVRHAAYGALPKRRRAEHHEQLADWMEQAAGDGVAAHDEIIGHHLERAHRFRAELGPADDRVRELASRAGGRLAAAGARAFTRGDSSGAISLLTRARELLGWSEAGLEVAVTLGEVLLLAGDAERAEAVLATARSAAVAAGSRRLEARIRTMTLPVQLVTRPERWAERARRELDQVTETLQALDDERGLEMAWAVRGLVAGSQCQLAECDAANRQALHWARRAGDTRREHMDLQAAVATLPFGPVPVFEGLRRCDEVAGRAGGSPRLEARLLGARAVLRGLQGEIDDARRLASRSKDILADLGTRVDPLSSMAIDFGSVELLAGDPWAAEREFRNGYDMADRHGDAESRGMMAGLVARALYLQGRYQQAELWTRVAERAATVWVAAGITWRSEQAKILARRGQPDAAEKLGRRAVELVRSTDLLVTRAAVLMDLVEVLDLVGRRREALPLLEEALAAAEQKGALALEVTARALLASGG